VVGAEKDRRESSELAIEKRWGGKCMRAEGVNLKKQYFVQGIKGCSSQGRGMGSRSLVKKKGFCRGP